MSLPEGERPPWCERDMGREREPQGEMPQWDEREPGASRGNRRLQTGVRHASGYNRY